MEEIYFMTLMPDDYHGAPQVKELTNDDFPLPPSEDWVYSTWAEAGYSYMEGEQDETQEEAFDDYGNQPCYYATYIIILENNKDPENLKMEIAEVMNDVCYGELCSVDKACDVIRSIQGVIDVFPIEFDR